MVEVGAEEKLELDEICTEELRMLEVWLEEVELELWVEEGLGPVEICTEGEDGFAEDCVVQDSELVELCVIAVDALEL
jgi:hypothetical protein